MWPRSGSTELETMPSMRLTSDLMPRRLRGATKGENKGLATKLTTSERDQNSALAGLKNAETQAEDQCKLLYQTKIELATSKQLALDLKAKL